MNRKAFISHLCLCPFIGMVRFLKVFYTSISPSYYDLVTQSEAKHSSYYVDDVWSGLIWVTVHHQGIWIQTVKFMFLLNGSRNLSYHHGYRFIDCKVRFGDSNCEEKLKTEDQIWIFLFVRKFAFVQDCETLKNL